jgi:hypothetical protein
MRHPFVHVLILLGLLASLLGGCATPRTATKKDLSVFHRGVARSAIIEEIGAPVSTTTSREGTTVDIFTFVQGTTPSKSPPRPVEPEQAEATELLVLMEQTGYSPSRLLTGKTITLQVNYDAEERVRDTVLLRME